MSKMCGSGMRTMMFAHDMLAAGSARSWWPAAWRA